MQYASTLILSIHLHFSRFQGWWRCLPWNRAGGRVPDLHQAAQHSCPAKQWHLGQCHGLVDGPQWWVQGGINVSATNSGVHSDQSGNKLQDFLGKLSFMPRSLEFWKVQLDTWVSEKKWYNLCKRCEHWQTSFNNILILYLSNKFKISLLIKKENSETNEKKSNEQIFHKYWL